jgi:hypothetical protein
MEPKYTIQEVRNMIAEFFESRNIYKYLDEAAGHKTVQEFLESVQLKDNEVRGHTNE